MTNGILPETRIFPCIIVIRLYSLCVAEDLYGALAAS